MGLFSSMCHANCPILKCFISPCNALHSLNVYLPSFHRVAHSSLDYSGPFCRKFPSLAVSTWLQPRRYNLAVYNLAAWLARVATLSLFPLVCLFVLQPYFTRLIVSGDMYISMVLRTLTIKFPQICFLSALSAFILLSLCRPTTRTT